MGRSSLSIAFFFVALVTPTACAESPFAALEGVWKSERYSQVLSSGKQLKFTEAFRFVVIGESFLIQLQPNRREQPLVQSDFLANDERDRRFYLLAERASLSKKIRYAISMGLAQVAEPRLALTFSRFPPGSEIVKEEEWLRRPSPSEKKELQNWLKELVSDETLDRETAKQARSVMNQIVNE